MSQFEGLIPSYLSDQVINIMFGLTHIFMCALIFQELAHGFASRFCFKLLDDCTASRIQLAISQDYSLFFVTVTNTNGSFLSRKALLPDKSIPRRVATQRGLNSLVITAG